MKAIFSMPLVLGVCGLAGAADDKVVDPLGTWKCEYEIGAQQRTSTLKIKKDGDNLAGTMSWPESLLRPRNAGSPLRASVGSTEAVVPD